MKDNYEKERLLVQGRTELTDLKYVQICGGFNNVKSSGFAAEIANNFSTVYGCPSYQMQVPAICGALSSGIMNVFVTNEYTAEQVLKKLS